MAQRFILQMLVALFAEDIGLLPRYLVARLLDDCKTKQDSFDLFGGLFEAMNTPRADRRRALPGRRLLQRRAVRRSGPRRVALDEWSAQGRRQGRLVEGPARNLRHAVRALPRERRAPRLRRPLHHPTDIMKIVGPTIVEPWRELIEEAETLKRLRDSGSGCTITRCSTRPAARGISSTSPIAS